jgi:predicted nuclease of restriction endonuclease-like RecB superfamily
LVPEKLLSYSISDRELVLHYFTERDQPWLRELLDQHDRFVGRPRRELAERCRQPFPFVAPSRKLRIATHVLGRLYEARHETAIPPVQARKVVFGAAAQNDLSREQLLDTLVSHLGVSVSELMDSLLGDLPGERRVQALAAPPSPAQLCLLINLDLAQTVLHCSSSVSIEIEGNARSIVRHAKLRGLICTVRPRTVGCDATLEISGPYSLFRRTLIYGRALAELIPLLAWCARFSLRSECSVNNRSLHFTLTNADPIMPASEPKQYDSRLEERFARAFAREAQGFDLIREPEAVPVDGTLIFPDFAIRSRQEPGRQWLLEIIGFWTSDYLQQKLARLRTAKIANLILCLDSERNCGDADLPDGVRVVRFRRRIDPVLVLEAMGVLAPTHSRRDSEGVAG